MPDWYIPARAGILEMHKKPLRVLLQSLPNTKNAPLFTHPFST